MKEEKKKTSSFATKVYDAFLLLGTVGVTLLVVVALLMSLVGFTAYLDDRREKEFRACGCAETVALNIVTSIASYYADPANQDVPTLEMLIKNGDLSSGSLNCGAFKHRATIEGISASSANYPDIKITVFLDEDCDYPRGNRYVKYLTPRDKDEMSQYEPEGWNY